ncbi:MAG TPA: NAD(P)H-dependent glycerol-3-phosphate dehydrogenase [Burkholderiaceae bacterium]|nr:NAD(P)H-dependent glycerol-3-phosphate dehydrogenase [Burkholderiaceae bacterium]
MRVTILGAGAWGTALACTLCSRHPTMLWARSAQQADGMQSTRRNDRYLPGRELDPALGITSDLDVALEHASDGLLFLAVPIASLRALVRQLQQRCFAGPCIWLCKGLERDTGMLAHQIIADEMPRNAAGPLSGPSFAEEVAQGLPTALVVAGTKELCERVTATVHGGNLRIYSTDDVVGVEVGGAVKNVMAIATGIADSLHLGHNARAALITRGLTETSRFGQALGARAETFTGLTGLGDLILTATGDPSRNRRIGLALGNGIALGDAVAGLGHVAEGVWSAPAIVARARALRIEMPISEAVCAVLEGRTSPRNAVERLLSRDPRAEVS